MSDGKYKLVAHIPSSLGEKFRLFVTTVSGTSFSPRGVAEKVPGKQSGWVSLYTKVT